MVTQQKNALRGIFRAMSFDQLQSSDSLPFWRDGEQSKNYYSLPLRTKPWRCGFLAFSWKRLAEQNGLLVDIPEDELYETSGIWCARSPESHIACFSQAIDFLVPVGTAILAAEDGEIIELIESNEEWGDGPQFRDTLNFITICHSQHPHFVGCQGEHTQYCHVLKGSVAKCGLSLGSRVKKGHKIAVVGLNGWTDRPHLHFILFRYDAENSQNQFGFKSLKPKFS